MVVIMKKDYITQMVIGSLIGLAIFAIAVPLTQRAEAAVVPFTSAQVGTSPVNGYILSTNGSKSTWIANSGGAGSVATTTIRNMFSATSPILYNSTTGDFSCLTVSGSQAGCLSLADWNIFNNKVGTSTLPNIGDVAYWTGAKTLGTVATGTLTENATGLQFDATRSLLGGSAVLSLTSGYSIPLTASTTNWNGFYDTPSTRITAGANCSWAGNTFNCTSAGGGGSISTSTVPVAGNLAYWTSGSALSDVATGTLTENATGLEFSATRGLVGGASILSLTSGFGIPLTASTTNWEGFYLTPSTRITAGTGIDWSGNTLNGVYTAGDALTLTGEDFDFDGGASPSGDLGGTWASPSVTDDSHAHTGTTLSGIDISSDTNLSADGTEIILTGDALSLGTALTFLTGTSTTSFFSGLGTFTNMVVSTLATFLNATVTGLLDVGGGVLEIPNGTGPTADDVGEIAHDTNDNQLILDDYVIRTKEEIYKFSVPSTSPAFATGTVKYLPPVEDGYVVSDIFCSVEGGTSKVILAFGEAITCDTDGQADDGTITIATIGASSTTVPVTASTTVGVVNWLNVTITGRWTRE